MAGALEKLVEGGFRLLLICSAVYFGAKYSPYVLSVADRIKDKIIPAHIFVHDQYRLYNTEPPAALMSTDPRLYNAILISQYVQSARPPVREDANAANASYNNLRGNNGK